MRKNEYKSLEEFKSQYVGEWAPSEGHWLGLDFIYDEKEYRFHTGYMFVGEKDSLFSLYEKRKFQNWMESSINCFLNMIPWMKSLRVKSLEIVHSKRLLWMITPS